MLCRNGLMSGCVLGTSLLRSTVRLRLQVRVTANLKDSSYWAFFRAFEKDMECVIGSCLLVPGL